MPSDKSIFTVTPTVYPPKVPKGVGTSGPCSTPDFIPASHFMLKSATGQRPQRVRDSSSFDCETEDLPQALVGPASTSVCRRSSSSGYQSDCATDITMPDQQGGTYPMEVKDELVTEDFVAVLRLEDGERHKGFGLRVMGGPEQNAQQVYVGELIPGCVAERSGLVRCGDIVMTVNGSSVLGKSHQHVASLIRASATERNGLLELSLRGSRLKQMGSRETYDVVLHRAEDEGFGFIIVNSCCGGNCRIDRVVPDSPASRAKSLHLGDYVLALNGTSVDGLDQYAIMKLIQLSNQDIILTVCRQPNSDSDSITTRSGSQCPSFRCHSGSPSVVPEPRPRHSASFSSLSSRSLSTNSSSRQSFASVACSSRSLDNAASSTAGVSQPRLPRVTDL